MPSSQDDRVFLARDGTEEKLFCKPLKKTVKTSALSERSWEILVTHIAEIEQYTGIKPGPLKMRSNIVVPTNSIE